ncbi:thymidine kinase, cytosolic [Lepeophtheirus salmonis]|uniref:Thymidine kinase n=2 Tax=Lepeophtheirus salmonis TaxID=72036 RepID=C1BTV6_LEPSM|nr:thymidine kinase, cytosolic-like [Lepeophtheirus salmonis]ACO12459.1 Thymidine kinase [Lepeophtheirus salmonis]ADD24208.1 Thymidine kinase [Lepeophtheirus salmonis]
MRDIINISQGSQFCVSKKMLPAQIQLIIGPMFSGKSTELIRRLKRYQIAKYKCLNIKYAKDTRYDSNAISTHDRIVLDAVSSLSLDTLKERAMDFDVIGIDEGQFFPDIVSFCETMANSGKIVVIAALDGTFQRKGFPNIMELVPLSESVTKLNSVCMICYGEGSYTKRTTNEKEIEVIGGTETYMSVCRTCYHS